MRQLKITKSITNRESASLDKYLQEIGKEELITVYKYKRKTGYHKKNGHRQAFTKVKIDKINA